MKADEWFQFNPGSYLSCERYSPLSPAARGGILALECWAWINGSFPAPTEGAGAAGFKPLASIIRCNSAEAMKIWSEIKHLAVKNNKNPQRLSFQHVEDKRHKQVELLKERSEKGRQSALARWAKNKR